MSSYDIFVLVIGVIIFYFIFRILAKVLRGIKAVVNTAQDIAARHQEKHAKAADATDNAGCDPQIAARCCDSQVQAAMAEAIIRSNNMLWYQLESYCKPEEKIPKMSLTAICFIILIADHLNLGQNTEFIHGIIQQLCAQTTSLSDAVMNTFYTHMWDVYADLKQHETQPGTAVAELFIRNVSSAIHQDIGNEQLALLRLLIPQFVEAIDGILG